MPVNPGCRHPGGGRSTAGLRPVAQPSRRAAATPLADALDPACSATGPAAPRGSDSPTTAAAVARRFISLPQAGISRRRPGPGLVGPRSDQSVAPMLHLVAGNLATEGVAEGVDRHPDLGDVVDPRLVGDEGPQTAMTGRVIRNVGVPVGRVAPDEVRGSTCRASSCPALSSRN